MWILRQLGLALTLAVAAGCSSQSPSDFAPSSRGDILVGTTWQEIAWYDSYDDSWHELGDEAAKPTLIFDKNGSFVQDMIGGCCRQIGTWRLDEQNKLVLSYTDGSNRDLEYDVRRLDVEEMHLAWPGHHGDVINRYVPVETVESNSR